MNEQDKVNDQALLEEKDIVNNLDFDTNDKQREIPVKSGILSNLKLLKLDNSIANEASPIDKGKNTPITPINLEGFPMEYMWKQEEKINEKFYPPRSKICKDDSNSNTPSSALNFSTFSTYLENNPMRRYFVPSPGHRKISPEINKNESPKFSSPEIINLKNAMNINKNVIITPDTVPNRKQNTEPKSVGRFTDTVRNTYLNMNVNMNVMNSPSCFIDKSGQNEGDSTMRRNHKSNTTMNLIPTDLFMVTDSGHSLSNLNINSEFLDEEREYNSNRFTHIKPQGNILHQNINNQIGGINKFSTPNHNNFASPSYLNKAMPSVPVTIPRMPVQGLAMYQRNCTTPQNNDMYYGYMNNMMINNGGEYYCNNTPYNTGMNQNLSPLNTNINSNFNSNYPNPNNMMNPNMNPHMNMSPNIPHMNMNGNMNMHNMNHNIPNVSPSFTSYIRKNSYPNVTQPMNQPKNQSMNQPINPNMNQNMTSPLISNSTTERNNSRQGSFPRPSSPNYLNMDNKSLAKQAFILAKDQSGCRYLQKKLDDEPEIANSLIYPNIIENITDLIKDPFGNYLVQKLFDYISEEKFYQVLAIISPNLTTIGLNSHGTRVVQKLIDYLKSDGLVQSFMTILKPNVINLLKDINGNHIIQKVMSNLGEECTRTIHDIIKNNVMDIAMHKHGCVVLQKCIDNMSEQIRCEIFDILIHNCATLIIDQFGNYVIQYILTRNNYNNNNRIILILVSDICYFSKQKFSSNVVEKCFNYCDKETLRLLVESFMKPEIIEELLLDMYGNYVIQKVISCTQVNEQAYMLSIIAPLLNKLKFYPFGPKLYNKLIITYPQLSTMMFSCQVNQDTSSEGNSPYKHDTQSKKDSGSIMSVSSNEVNNSYHSFNNDRNRNKNASFNNI